MCLEAETGMDVNGEDLPSVVALSLEGAAVV